MNNQPGGLYEWCGPLRRNEARLKPGDLVAALAEFTQITGLLPAAVQLNPKNEKLAKELPDGMKVDYFAGCLAWMVGILGGETAPVIVATAPVTETILENVDKTPPEVLKNARRAVPPCKGRALGVSGGKASRVKQERPSLDDSGAGLGVKSTKRNVASGENGKEKRPGRGKPRQLELFAPGGKR